MFQILARSLGWCLGAYIIFVTLSPLGLRPETGAPPQFERFLAFFVLGAVFAAGYPKRWPLVMAALGLVAILLEVGQEFAPSRHAHLRDAVAKVLGAVIGVGGVKLLLAAGASRGVDPTKPR
jgi:hypothetical protein